jgi:dethiobiotin synthetase
VPGLFVTATGTGIGKTYVAARLVEHLRRRGNEVRAFKPVVTGYAEHTIDESDSAVLLAALGEPASPDRIGIVSPWRYRAPLGPIAAAAAEGRRIDFGAIASFVVEVFRASGTAFTVVEGLGGVMVPFDEEHTLLDLLTRAAVPAIVVTGTYLGSLSHTLSALEVLRARSVQVAGVVVNESFASAITVDATAAALAPFVKRSGSRVVGLRHDPTPGELAAMCEAVLGTL